MVEKAVNIEAKVSLQLPSKTRKIHSRCPRGYRLLVKKDKDDANRKHQDGDKDKNKAKSHNLSFANCQLQTQTSKKNKCHENCRRGHPATEINITKVAKKDKDKAIDLSYIECYTCKQKVYYANKCPKKSKN